jgi:hypothetical protein
MNKKSIILFVLISFFALSFSMYQYVKEFRSNFVDAYSTVKPANGHLWSEMECSSSVCLSGGNVGIGTDSPNYKLKVVGTTMLDGATTIYNDIGSSILSLIPASGANGRQSTINFWSTFSNYPTDMGSRLAGRITSGFGNGVWGTEYMSFGVGGAGDAANPPTEKMRLDADGNLQASGDICNGSGACLSQMSQFVAAKTLVNNVHNYKNCTDLGGEVVDSGQIGEQCRFNLAACPNGWTQFRYYNTVGGTTTSCCIGDNGTTWSDQCNPIHNCVTCGGLSWGDHWDGAAACTVWGGASGVWSCWRQACATPKPILQVGCY